MRNRSLCGGTGSGGRVSSSAVVVHAAATCVGAVVGSINIRREARLVVVLRVVATTAATSSGKASSVVTRSHMADCVSVSGGLRISPGVGALPHGDVVLHVTIGIVGEASKGWRRHSVRRLSLSLSTTALHGNLRDRRRRVCRRRDSAAASRDGDRHCTSLRDAVADGRRLLETELGDGLARATVGDRGAVGGDGNRALARVVGRSSVGDCGSASNAGRARYGHGRRDGRPAVYRLSGRLAILRSRRR